MISIFSGIFSSRERRRRFANDDLTRGALGELEDSFDDLAVLFRQDAGLFSIREDQEQLFLRVGHLGVARRTNSKEAQDQIESD